MTPTTIMLLIVLLGHRDFRTRERAYAKLDANIEIAIPYLFTQEEARDPEISARCRALVTKWINKHIDELTQAWLPAHWRNWPWITAITVDQCELVDALMQQAQEDNPATSNTYRLSAAATRLWVKSLILARKPVEPTLRKLCELHKQMCIDNGWRIPPDPVFTAKDTHR